MVFDSAAWQIGKFVFEVGRHDPIDTQKLDSIFDQIKSYHFTRPSESYTFLYKAFHKAHDVWHRFLEFADWWDYRNFRPEDYLKEQLPNEKTVMSLAEQAYIGYAKKLLEGEFIDSYSPEKRVSKEKVEAFLPKLEQIIQQHPEYQYPPYFKAKLLLALGGEASPLEALLPFAKNKRGEFWVWDVMAEIFSKEPEKEIACLCKALSCGAPNDFLIKVRAKLARHLIAAQRYAEAKTEIEQIVAARESHGWKIPQEIANWKNASWYDSASSSPNNKKFYQERIPLADQILYADVPEEIAVVEFVNRDKKILNFIVSKQKYGFLKYDRFLPQVSVGDFLKVRLEGSGHNVLFKALTLEKTEQPDDSAVVKNFEGPCRIRSGQAFGFVDDVFLSPELVKKHGLEDGVAVKGLAIASFNGKKGEWGWKGVGVKGKADS